jgi:uncharacterized protein
MKLKNKTVLITGASSGIGRALAIRCAKDGANLILASRNLEKLQEVAKQVELNGGKAEIVICDVSKTEDIKNLFLKATSNGRVLDVVFNNAGLGFIAPLTSLTTKEIEEMIDVNIKGMIQVAKFSSEVFSRQKYGHLFFTSSIAGLVSLAEWSVYVGTKWAITGFAASIRNEFKSFGAKVTTINPGPVATNFFSDEKADIDFNKLGGAMTSEYVAEKAYKYIFKNKKQIILPSIAMFVTFLYRIFPNIMSFIFDKSMSNYDYGQKKSGEDMGEFDYIKPVSSGRNNVD